MRIDPVVYAGLDAETKAYVDQELAAYEAIVTRNPLQGFSPISEAQRTFLEAKTPVVAAFAGNRFGKTTSLVVRALIEAVDDDAVPKSLKHIKRYPTASGWIIVPTTDKLYDTLIPCLQKWVPKDQLVQKKWDRSWSKERRQLNFKNGSTLAFKTYEQDAATLGGAALHFVGYDEPPPKAHREECLTRLIDHRGYEMFAMTPLKTNTGWIRRDIWRNREHPDITVIKGSMHDNPLLDEATKQRVLGTFTDLWRRAREFGDFVDVGGLVYPDFERCVRDPWPADFVQGLDVVVGIDPGIRNAGVVFVGFDAENVAYVFDELLLQDKTPKHYAAAIRAKLDRWRILRARVNHVCDPAARQRGQTNAETVLSALNKEGIYANTGQNDVEAGIGQVRTRMAHDRFLVSRDCRGLRDEADDYAAREPDEGKDDSHLEPIKGNDHRLDALRYAVMERFWDPVMEEQAPRRLLGYDPVTTRVNPGAIRVAQAAAPMGFMS